MQLLRMSDRRYSSRDPVPNQSRDCPDIYSGKDCAKQFRLLGSLGRPFQQNRHKKASYVSVWQVEAEFANRERNNWKYLLVCIEINRHVAERLNIVAGSLTVPDISNISKVIWD
jgi:hypothetical protein